MFTFHSSFALDNLELLTDQTSESELRMGNEMHWSTIFI